MKTQRNDFRAGLFIVISIVLIVAIIVGIKGIGRIFQPAQHPTVTFRLTDDIGGLSVGDDVRIGGYKVGVVRRIEIEKNAAGEPIIEVSFSIPEKYDLRSDARISVQGTLTGVSWLNFENLGTGAKLTGTDRLIGRPSPIGALLAAAGDIAPKIRDETIPKANAAIDTFRGTGMHATALIKLVRSKIDPIIERYNTIADRGSEALTQIRDVFGESKTDFKGTVANLNAATGTFKDKLPGIMDKASGLLTNIDNSVTKASVRAGGREGNSRQRQDDHCVGEIGSAQQPREDRRDDREPEGNR